ncbi:MAG TPA: FAD-dependent oxidoreductase, partial [Gammaproteobacteria bacterium]|nr:FAD-dependent oxidoreductase [Gammaproteobacteria bacterium]
YAGETVMLSGRAAMVAGRAGARLKALVLPIDRLRELIVTHAELGEIIIRSFILRRVRLIAAQASDTLVAGSRHTPATQQLLEFLTRNGHPYTFLCLDAARDMSEVLQRFEFGPEDTPIVLTSSGEPLRNPSLREVADRLGLSLQWDRQTVYDLAVVGAGPAGLASAVYAASEGLDVVVLDPVAPGGQAGTSSRIENYLGFPTGISGQALAGRAFIQAQKFGAKIMVPAALKRLHCGNPYHELELDGGERLRSRSVVIASGAKYRKPPLRELERFEGAGVYYGATFLEAQLCRDDEVAVIGGGNSAGQAAVFLSGTAKKVYVLVRSEGLAASMSKYLIRRIETTPNIELLTRSEVVALHGESTLESIRWRDNADGAETDCPVQHLFVFIGATPNSDFLPEAVLTDSNGFICTGSEVVSNGAAWPLERAPFPLETSCPGIFAAGDVRATSTKRVASAVGEGSVAVQYVHRVLGAE